MKVQMALLGMTVACPPVTRRWRVPALLLRALDRRLLVHPLPHRLADDLQAVPLRASAPKLGRSKTWTRAARMVHGAPPEPASPATDVECSEAMDAARRYIDNNPKRWTQSKPTRSTRWRTAGLVLVPIPLECNESTSDHRVPR
jgi:hypothetical protein